LLPWKSNKYYTFIVGVCSLCYPARNMHAPYCQLWPVWLYYIFPYYFINGRIFEKKVTQHKVCIDFLYSFFSQTFLITARIRRVIIITIHTLSCTVPVILFNMQLIKLEYSRNIFEKYTSIKFHKDPSSGIRVVPCGHRHRGDGQTDMTKLTVNFRNFANVPKTKKKVK
jgi:hypothetical protein